MLIFTIFGGGYDQSSRKAIFANTKPYKAGIFRRGNIGFYFEPPVEDTRSEHPDDDSSSFFSLVIRRENADRQKRIDVILRLAEPPDRLHLRVTGDDTLYFDGDVPYSSDDPEEEPFFVFTNNVEQRAAANP